LRHDHADCPAGIENSEFPKVADHYQRMLSRPAVAKALAN